MRCYSKDETLTTLFKTEEGKPQEPSVKITPKTTLAEEDEKPWYVCKNCQQRLTRPSDRMIVQGSHTHTFANPSGVVFEIACFASARGYSFLGPPSTDFTWFNGYSWRIVICSACISHLGWFFSSQSENRFFGLITDRILLLPNIPI
jgi:hypothetical protein